MRRRSALSAARGRHNDCIFDCAMSQRNNATRRRAVIRAHIVIDYSACGLNCGATSEAAG